MLILTLKKYYITIELTITLFFISTQKSESPCRCETSLRCNKIRTSDDKSSGFIRYRKHFSERNYGGCVQNCGKPEDESAIRRKTAQTTTFTNDFPYSRLKNDLLVILFFQCASIQDGIYFMKSGPIAGGVSDVSTELRRYDSEEQTTLLMRKVKFSVASLEGKCKRDNCCFPMNFLRRY